MKQSIIAIMIILILTLSGCSGFENNNNTTSNNNITTYDSSDKTEKQPDNIDDSTDNSSYNENISEAERILSEMSLEEKIGQLFIIRPEKLNLNENEIAGLTEVTDKMLETISTYNIGGICMFKDNIISPTQVSSYISSLQSGSNIPMFITVDEEGGLVSRIANCDAFNVTKYESMEAVGATNNPDNAKLMGTTIGSYLREYGFNLDFAPVADVNTNPSNIVIGNRAFGNDPHLVASMVSSAIDGFNSAGIMCCVKHFPGHGDTTGDTHDGYVSITKTWDNLKECELVPFITAINNDVDTIMVSHITTPNITSDSLPASMSYEMVTERLRNELGYNGVVITDAMEMGAIANHYTSSTGAVTALKAGIDIILMPEDFVEAYNGVYEAVINSDISEDRIDESVQRILRLKEKYGILK